MTKQDTDFPVNVFKQNANFFAKQMTLQFGESICPSKQPESFKFASITPAFKQGSRSLQGNYRPISILQIISKTFEQLMCKQFSNLLTKQFQNFQYFQCGFRNRFGTHNCLLLMIDKWKKAVDGNKVFSSILTDISKASGCIFDDLLVPKLHAYGL